MTCRKRPAAKASREQTRTGRTSLALAGLAGLSLLTSQVAAEVLYTGKGYITRLAAYDDYQDGMVGVWFPTGLSECAAGVYVNAKAPGAEAMVAFVLSAYRDKLKVRFQAYSDRLYKTSLCEADAVILER